MITKTEKINALKDVLFYLVNGIALYFLFSSYFAREFSQFKLYSILFILIHCTRIAYFYAKGKYETVESFIGNFVLCFFVLFLLLPYIGNISLIQAFQLEVYFPNKNNQLIEHFLFAVICFLIAGFLRVLLAKIWIQSKTNLQEFYIFISFFCLLTTLFWGILSNIPDFEKTITELDFSVVNKAMNHFEQIDELTPEKFKNGVIGGLGAISGVYIKVLKKYEEQKQENLKKLKNEKDS